MESSRTREKIGAWIKDRWVFLPPKGRRVSEFKRYLPDLSQIERDELRAFANALSRALGARGKKPVGEPEIPAPKMMIAP